MVNWVKLRGFPRGKRLCVLPARKNCPPFFLRPNPLPPPAFHMFAIGGLYFNNHLIDGLTFSSEAATFRFRRQNIDNLRCLSVSRCHSLFCSWTADPLVAELLSPPSPASTILAANGLLLFGAGRESFFAPFFPQWPYFFLVEGIKTFFSPLDFCLDRGGIFSISLCPPDQPFAPGISQQIPFAAWSSSGATATVISIRPFKAFFACASFFPSLGDRPGHNKRLPDFSHWFC